MDIITRLNSEVKKNEDIGVANINVDILTMKHLLYKIEILEGIVELQKGLIKIKTDLLNKQL